MEKLALILWSIIPKKVEQVQMIGGNSAYGITLIWLGRKFEVSIKR
jgi:hypothetical protein